MNIGYMLGSIAVKWICGLVAAEVARKLKFGPLGQLVAAGAVIMTLSMVTISSESPENWFAAFLALAIITWRCMKQ